MSAKWDMEDTGWRAVGSKAVAGCHQPNQLTGHKVRDRKRSWKLPGDGW